jgi:hypothetical protein
MRRANIIMMLMIAAHAICAVAQSTPQNPHGPLRWDCQDCHSVDSWRTMANPMKFNHKKTGFVLVGAHASATCAGCHTDLHFKSVKTECADCHTDTHRGQLGLDCQRCHTPEDWSDRQEVFSQHAQKGFPLIGVHATVSCDACHGTAQPREFAGTPTECKACHLQTYTATQDPNHTAAGFSLDCISCHGQSSQSWLGAAFEHPAAFPLSAGHSHATCNTCHSQGYAGTSTACVSCHESQYRQTPDPNHVTAGFSTDCLQCHTTVAWSPATLDHNLTKFPLTGAHASVDCSSCHEKGFTGTSSTCFACHESNYAATQNPNHAVAGFPHDCQQCHSTTGWHPAALNHDLTGFPLTGAHRTVDCTKCHPSGYTGTSTACYSCHQTDFTGVHDPNHLTAGFSTDCQQCHTTTAWTPASLDHNVTGFPLTGAHVSVSCQNCHAAGFTGTSTACFACHESDYRNVADPNHVTAGFATTCVPCHTTAGWKPAQIDHNTTGFPLTGAHASVACNSCHAAKFAGTPTACFSCHESDFTGVVDPNHVSAGFSHDCASCHTTTAWKPAQLDHNVTGFPLTGAHVSVSCNSCHASGFTGTATACYACHQADYAGVADPNHTAAGFSHECTPCHTTSAWKPAAFDHSTTGFPLTGAHVSVTCGNCHTTGYAGMSPNCYGCHSAQYASATNPNHTALGYPTDCAQCHTTTAWQPASFDHNQSGFPLTGAHTSVTCNSCHSAGFAGTPTECVSCHRSDYTSVTDPNHVSAGFSTACVSCHTTAAWKPATLDHNLTKFPLTGAHVTVACNSCHASGFTGTPTDCYSCHQTDYANVADPNHASSGFSHACTDCHTMSGWKPASFNHDLSHFPLTGAHKAVACNTCHTAGFTGTSTDCFACHGHDYASTAEPNHTLAAFSHECLSCHSTDAWKPAQWSHDQTGFVLTGAHKNVTCNSCHATKFAGTSSACLACHQQDYNTAADPNHVQGGFPTLCEQCHTTTAWKPATFDHNLSGFPLTGAHTHVACNSCHASGFTGTPTACDACHHTDYTGVTDPNHVAAGFSTTCTQCHTTTAWTPSSFNHNTTGFVLTGAHTQATCISCHSKGFAGTASACYACHQSNYTSATSPNHVAGGYPTLCEQCHTTTAWQPSSFNHNTTGFVLTGAHITVQCSQCHKNGYTGGTPTACVSCHQSDYNASLLPKHSLAGFSTDCAPCHTTTAWRPSSYNHAVTGFTLTGAHKNVTCNSCHATKFAGTSSACLACHQQDYNTAADPNHVQGGFPTLCEQCHTTTAWKPATFDHNLSGFPLTGAHTHVACNSCHASGFTGTPTACDACHHTDYTGVTDPNHIAAGFSTTCTQCHTTTAWTPSSFNHNTTGFVLTGAHTQATCISCHSKGFAGTASACYACHQSNYTSATSPNHVAGGYPTLCEQCHTTTAWQPSSFNHNTTGFVLTGAHTQATCTSCHASGFAGTPSACYACHQSNYASTTNPNHVAGGYPTLCEQCHTTTAWQPSSFNHNTTGFALTGAHTQVTCNSCHASGFAGTPSACYACHQSNYASTTNPNHVAGGYPTLCEQCHTTIAWQPASFDHNLSGFPLTGAHITVACNSCHASGFTGTPTACYACHQTDFTGTTNPNHVSAGFPTTCQTCHTTTAWAPSTFNHSQTAFPLTGAHTSVTCVSCHAAGYSGTPTACNACHLSDYNGTTNPVHTAAHFPTTCQTCHTTTAWTPSTWNHDTQFFPIYSGRHRSVWTSCATCHVNAADYKVFECILCHEHNKSDTDSHHQGVRNYQYLSTACYSCHPRGSS